MSGRDVGGSWQALLECGVAAGQWYTHFRTGDVYEVLEVSLDEETLGVRVTYRSEATGWRWNRRLEAFVATAYIYDGEARATKFKELEAAIRDEAADVANVCSALSAPKEVGAKAVEPTSELPCKGLMPWRGGLASCRVGCPTCAGARR